MVGYLGRSRRQCCRLAESKEKCDLSSDLSSSRGRPSNLIARLPGGSDSVNGVNMDHVSILQVLESAMCHGLSLSLFQVCLE